MASQVQATSKALSIQSSARKPAAATFSFT